MNLSYKFERFRLYMFFQPCQLLWLCYSAQARNACEGSATWLNTQLLCIFIERRQRHEHTVTMYIHGTQVQLEDSEEAMSAALRWTYITGGTLTFILIFAWPLLTLPQVYPQMMI